MNTLTIIYCAACLGLGFFAGLVVELAMDSSYVTKLEKEIEGLITLNENLLLKLEAAEKNAMVSRGVIEIVDNTIDIPDFPNSHKY